MPVARVRFYAHLNEFLAYRRRQRTFAHSFDGSPSVKDMIESLGVPHTEIDLILVDGDSVRFSHKLRGGERVAVYPVFERLDIRPLCRLRPRPLRRARFVADVHLGALTRRLRLLGFDTLYGRDWDDAHLAAVSAREARILLTRDIGLLKYKSVMRGHWVRGTDPRRQLEEVLRAFSLGRDLQPFTRCTVCNGRLRLVARAAVFGRVPPRVYARFRRFVRCIRCKRIYWRGSHYNRLQALTRSLRQAMRSARQPAGAGQRASG